MPPLAVLFDFDGVLVDTANVHVAAWQRTLALMGWLVPEDRVLRSMGEDDFLFLADLLTERGVTGGDVVGWVRRKRELAATLMADCPRLYPGAAALVRHLSEIARLAIVTSASREIVLAALSASNLTHFFETIVAKEDVAQPKPDPACYLEALKRLSLKPEQARAIEDSPTGLQACRAARIPAVAVGSLLPEGEWSEGAVFVEKLSDMPAVQRALGFPS